MIHYTAVNNPYFQLKPEFKNLGLPLTVSAYGSLPSPLEAYEKKHRPSLEINHNGRITYSNYFKGKILATFEQAIQMAAELNKPKEIAA